MLHTQNVTIHFILYVYIQYIIILYENVLYSFKCIKTWLMILFCADFLSNLWPSDVQMQHTISNKQIMATTKIIRHFKAYYCFRCLAHSYWEWENRFKQNWVYRMSRIHWFEKCIRFVQCTLCVKHFYSSKLNSIKA